MKFYRSRNHVNITVSQSKLLSLTEIDFFQNYSATEKLFSFAEMKSLQITVSQNKLFSFTKIESFKNYSVAEQITPFCRNRIISELQCHRSNYSALQKQTSKLQCHRSSSTEQRGSHFKITELDPLENEIIQIYKIKSHRRGNYSDLQNSIPLKTKLFSFTEI